MGLHAIFATLEFGIFPAEEFVRELQDEGLVGLWNPEDACNHLQGMKRSHVGDEVALTLGAQSIDELSGGLPHHRAERLDRARPEEGGRDLSVLAVIRRIHVDDGPDGLTGSLALAEVANQRHSRCIQEQVRLFRDLNDVRVLREAPDHGPIRRLDAGYGLVAAQACPLLVGIPILRVAGGVDQA